MKTARLVLACMTGFLPVVGMAADPVDVNYEMQRIDARYRIFKTANIWNLLELDTQTGSVWQLQFSTGSTDGRMKMEVRSEVVADGSKPGRFTLYPTRNMFNFIMLDQDTGKTWQVQWSTSGNYGAWPIDSLK
jgi:hypothetical protein